MNELIPLPLPENKDAGQPSSEAIRSPRWKIFAAPAGALALVLAIGWTVAARIDDATHTPSPEQIAASAAAASASAAEALRSAETQRQEIAALRGHVETLKTKLEAQAQKTHASEATIAALQRNLAEQKADAAAAQSQLQARIEKVQTLAMEKAPAEKAQAEKTLAEKIVDRGPVASVPKPPTKPLPTTLPKAVAAQPAPGPYRAFVLRDVAGGRAVVEGVRGLEEVGPGEILPGGARVEKIERRGVNWVVLTDRGVIAPDGRWDN